MRPRDYVRAIVLATPVLLLVVTLLAVRFGIRELLSAHGSPSKRETAEADIARYVQALHEFRKHRGHYPTDRQGLRAISDSEQGAWYPQVPVAPDPWQTPYRYALSNDVPCVTSAGADRVFDTPDDIRN